MIEVSADSTCISTYYCYMRYLPQIPLCCKSARVIYNYHLATHTIDVILRNAGLSSVTEFPSKCGSRSGRGLLPYFFFNNAVLNLPFSDTVGLTSQQGPITIVFKSTIYHSTLAYHDVDHWRPEIKARGTYWLSETE